MTLATADTLLPVLCDWLADLHWLVAGERVRGLLVVGANEDELELVLRPTYRIEHLLQDTDPNTVVVLLEVWASRNHFCVNAHRPVLGTERGLNLAQCILPLRSQLADHIADVSRLYRREIARLEQAAAALAIDPRPSLHCAEPPCPNHFRCNGGLHRCAASAASLRAL